MSSEWHRVTPFKVIRMTHCIGRKSFGWDSELPYDLKKEDRRQTFNLTVVFAQSTEARCSVKNEDVVGAAPTGDVPTTSEWSAILLATRVRLILDARWYQRNGNYLENIEYLGEPTQLILDGEGDDARFVAWWVAVNRRRGLELRYVIK